jgi:hypothetical protein
LQAVSDEQLLERTVFGLSFEITVEVAQAEDSVSK